MTMLVIRTSALLGAMLVVAFLLRRRSGALRHRLWSSLFAAVLALPLLVVTLPARSVWRTEMLCAPCVSAAGV